MDKRRSVMENAGISCGLKNKPTGYPLRFPQLRRMPFTHKPTGTAITATITHSYIHRINIHFLSKTSKKEGYLPPASIIIVAPKALSFLFEYRSGT